MHILGGKAHFALGVDLQNVADHYGLTITNKGQNVYAIESKDPAVDLDALCPSYVKKQGTLFDLQNTRAFLKHLHQPLNATIKTATEPRKKGESKKAYKKESHEKRVSLHRFLRFATTGSVEIASDHSHHDLDGESCDCHAATEQAARDDDSWLNSFELGHDEESISAVPHTHFDLDKGFVFDIDKKVISSDAQKGRYQKEVQTLFWSIINDVTSSRYANYETPVHLSARELEDFSKQALEQNLSKLVDRVEFEEEVLGRVENIKKRERKLKTDMRFKTVRGEENKKLNDLIHATSALTPIVDSQMMKDLWTRYHFMDRNKSPLSTISKEYGILLATMEAYKEKGDISAESLEAISQEFYSLMSFSKKFSKHIEEASLANNITTPIDKDITNAFAQTSSQGAEMRDKFLKDEHQDALDTLEKGLGLNKSSFISKGASAGADTFVDFTGDLVNFIKESPRTAATFTAFATTLFILNGAGDADTAQAASEYMAYSYDMDAGKVVEVEVDPTTVPKEAFEYANWHWDLGILGPYKHYMYDNVIVGPTQKVMDGIRQGIQWAYMQAGIPIDLNSVYSQTSDAVVQPLADKLFALNIFQNASHAAFWMYMTSKGFKHGLKGAERVFELLAPVTDLGYQTSLSISELLGRKKHLSVADRLMLLTSNERKPHARFEGELNIPKYIVPQCKVGDESCTLVALAKAAEARANLVNVLPEDMRFKDVGFKLSGLKNQFTVSVENLQPTLNALKDFDMTLEHMADRIGIEDSWYQSFLQERIQNCTNAIEAFKEDKNSAKLIKELEENLDDVIGSELRQKEHSKILDALNIQDFDENAVAKLNKKSNRKFAGLKRKHFIDHKRADIKDRKNPLSLIGQVKARASLLGTRLWGGVVKVSRAVADKGKFLTKKEAIIGMSAVALASIGLDLAQGYGNALTDFISMISTGALSGTVTSTAFGIYNFIEDVLGVHVGSGAMLIGVGAAARYAYVQNLKPAFDLSVEKITLNFNWNLKQAWNKNVYKPVSGFVQKIETELKTFDTKMGLAWSEARKPLSEQEQKRIDVLRRNAHNDHKHCTHHHHHEHVMP